MSNNLSQSSIKPEISIPRNITTAISTCGQHSITTSACSNRQKQESESIQELVNDLSTLLNNRDPPFADVKLSCGSVVFLAHKVILSVRSPVFADMFKTDKKESRCVIDDMEPSVLRAMLCYIYSGRVQELNPSTAFELLTAAETYLLYSLKQICSDYLTATISEDNVLAMLVIGNQHDNDLKMRAIDFICKCMKFSALENSDEWEKLQSKNPSLAVEVLSSIIRSYQYDKN